MTDITDAHEIVELKPCPFCGCGPSEDQHAEKVQAYIGLGGWCVFCEACGCEGLRLASRAEAIAAWNTRTPDASQAELVSALEDARLFVDLIRLQAARKQDAEQLAEATDALRGVDAALAKIGGAA